MKLTNCFLHHTKVLLQHRGWEPSTNIKPVSFKVSRRIIQIFCAHLSVSFEAEYEADGSKNCCESLQLLALNYKNGVSGQLILREKFQISYQILLFWGSFSWQFVFGYNGKCGGQLTLYRLPLA